MFPGGGGQRSCRYHACRRDGKHEVQVELRGNSPGMGGGKVGAWGMVIEKKGVPEVLNKKMAEPTSLWDYQKPGGFSEIVEVPLGGHEKRHFCREGYRRWGGEKGPGYEKRLKKGVRGGGEEN